MFDKDVSASTTQMSPVTVPQPFVMEFVCFPSVAMELCPVAGNDG